MTLMTTYLSFLHAKRVLCLILFFSLLKTLHQPLIAGKAELKNGVEACENHCHNQTECDAVGNGSCCQWDDDNDQCMSNIGQSICSQQATTMNHLATAHLSRSSPPRSIACSQQMTLIASSKSSRAVYDTTSRGGLSDVEFEPAPTSSPTKYNERLCSSDTISWIDFYLLCERGMTITQVAISIVAGKISAVISMFGSIYIIQDVLQNPEKRNESPYHRVMLGLSCSDIMISFFGFFLSTWPMPKGTHLFAVGSEGSCITVGFFLYIACFTAPLYTCSLVTFYLMKLKFNWNKRKIKAVEKWMHILPWTVGLISAISAAASSALGPYHNSCW